MVIYKLIADRLQVMRPFPVSVNQALACSRGVSGPALTPNLCQRKVGMSGFSQDRNVRFHGLLQG